MNIVKKSLITAMFTVFSLSAFAADNIGEQADQIGEQINQVTNMMVFGGTLLGIVFLIVGGLNLKKHGDNPQQVPLSKPLIFLTAGAILFGLGSTSDLMQSTLFGDDGGREESSGGTFDDFD